MSITRAHFKYALGFVKKQEEMARADSLAKYLSYKDVAGLWKTMHKSVASWLLKCLFFLKTL